MKKRILAAALTLFFIVGTAGMGFAAKLKCEVTAVDGDNVTMTCEGHDKLKDDDKLKAGDKVRVNKSKGGAIEGC